MTHENAAVTEQMIFKKSNDKAALADSTLSLNKRVASIRRARLPTENELEIRSAGGLRWSVAAVKDMSIPLHVRIFKRATDVILSAIALVFLTPLLVAAAVAVVTTSKGPVFFVQSRPGLNGVPFRMLKFRSMYTELGDVSGVAQTVKNDLRVTTVGAFLRKTSIDELPQLINVLLGHMSLVGPRPHPHGMVAAGIRYEMLVPYYDLRHAVRPGLSGWAQVNGLRGPTTEVVSAVSRIDHDLAYIQNMSILLDVRVITRTILQELRGGTGF